MLSQKICCFAVSIALLSLWPAPFSFWMTHSCRSAISQIDLSLLINYTCARSSLRNQHIHTCRFRLSRLVSGSALMLEWEQLQNNPVWNIGFRTMEMVNKETHNRAVGTGSHLTLLAVCLLHELLQQWQTLWAKRSLLSMCGINSRAPLCCTEAKMFVPKSNFPAFHFFFFFFLYLFFYLFSPHFMQVIPVS